MAGLDPAIHVLALEQQERTWMPGTRPGMTIVVVLLRDSKTLYLIGGAYWMPPALQS